MDYITAGEYCTLGINKDGLIFTTDIGRSMTEFIQKYNFKNYTSIASGGYGSIALNGDGNFYTSNSYCREEIPTWRR